MTLPKTVDQLFDRFPLRVTLVSPGGEVTHKWGRDEHGKLVLRGGNAPLWLATRVTTPGRVWKDRRAAL